jgi:biopolymer transport protein ExbB/TolQ
MLLFAQAETSADVQDQIFDLVGNSIYGILGLLSLWGLYLVVMTWRRVGAKRFRNEEKLNKFLAAVEEPLLEKDFEGVAEICDRDKRAMAQLVYMAVLNRALGYIQVRQLLADRFRRDILADLENRCSLINTVVKSAPMVGLFGTVIGMMGAFGKLATADQVDPAILAGNIMVALITTASGLAIAIPLTIMLAFINIRIRKMEDMVGAGLTRFLPGLKQSLDD